MDGTRAVHLGWRGRIDTAEAARQAGFFPTIFLNRGGGVVRNGEEDGPPIFAALVAGGAGCGDPIDLPVGQVWTSAHFRYAARADDSGVCDGVVDNSFPAGRYRQELLSGVPIAQQFETLREYLRAFPDVALKSDDYEEAAAFFNRGRAKGVQGSNTDFLICAVAVRRKFAILTADSDFTHFAKLLPIQLHSPRS